MQNVSIYFWIDSIASIYFLQASHSHHGSAGHSVPISNSYGTSSHSSGHHNSHTTTIQNTYQPAPSNHYQQPAVSYGISDPVLQHQPVSNHYEVKRENLRQPPSAGHDNPFLRGRRPKTLKVNVKTLPKQRFDRLQKREEDPRSGWIPIPRPVYDR